MAHRFFGERQYKDKYGFRWRGNEVTRIEGFSDAVFAFSVTLLIVSLEVPRTFAQLLTTMKGFAAFAASFAILIWLWHIHYMFFRRYGLQDAFTKTINAFLLFVVLFYIYPLKFVFTNVIHFWTGGVNSTVLGDGSVVPIVGQGDPAAMMIVYAIGFIAVFLCYVLLYWNARRKSEELRLSRTELFLTSIHLKQYIICILIGLLSLGIVLYGGDDMSAWSGFAYALLGPVLAIHGFMGSRQLKILEAQSQPQQQQQRSFQPRQGQEHHRHQQRSGQQRHQGQQRPQGQRHPGQQRHQGQRPDQRRQQPPQQGGQQPGQPPPRPENPE